MWKSDNFKRGEFACKCGCGMDTVDYGLILGLESLREKLNDLAGSPVRIHITSGNRCKQYNDKVGGEVFSQHLRSRAADIQCEQLIDSHWSQIAPEIVADEAEKLPFGGVGRYKTFTHVDTRAGVARWSKT
jgi:uncharacterized protein YcbK (DUF882 family)